jgi:hypothetical protein
MHVNRPPESIVVGNRQRLVAQLRGPPHEILRVRGSVEEAEVGVAMQLGVTDHVVRLIERMFD